MSDDQQAADLARLNYLAQSLQADNTRLAQELARAREEGRRLEGEGKRLRAACDEAHQLLWHYDLVQQMNGVDWGPVDTLRRDVMNKLEAALGLGAAATGANHD